MAGASSKTLNEKLNMCVPSSRLQKLKEKKNAQVTDT